MGTTLSTVSPIASAEQVRNPLDPSISRQLVDKMYEKRKAAALDLEKCVLYEMHD